MSENLIIKNFGPIKDVQLDLRKLNVIIGENATGKSTVAKILGVCKYFSYIIDSSSISGVNFEQGLYDWGLSDFIMDDTFIRYECDHYVFSATRKIEEDYDPRTGETIMVIAVFDTKLKPVSEKFQSLLKELDTINPNNSDGNTYGYVDFDWKIPTSFFKNDVAPILDNPFYLHTERGLQSIFSLGKNSIQNISDSLFNHFAKLDQITRLFKNDTLIEPLDITYKNVDGKGYIKKIDEDKFYSLNNGASGYKSTIPIVLTMKYYTESKFHKKNKTFIIEEPELNLFPQAQQKLVEYLVDRALNYGNSLLITTHSPYLLSSLNNLMYAWQVGQNNREDSESIIEKKHWLNPDEVSVYMLLADGTCEDIMDKEEQMIKVEKIDSVSDILNRQFNALLNFELTVK